MDEANSMITYQPAQLPQIDLIDPTDIPSSFADRGGRWLADRTLALLPASESVFALVHADDGVIWGRLENRGLIVSRDAEVAPLRSATVQQCRLFSPSGELFMWRVSDNRWRGRVMTDTDKMPYSVIEEHQILWGRKVEPALGGFSRLYEEGEGFSQLVPFEITQDEVDANRPSLVVRHYVAEDSDGQCRIAFSRLSGFDLNTEKKR
jgi:CRISPR-associated protein (TIGR03984 family)